MPLDTLGLQSRWDPPVMSCPHQPTPMNTCPDPGDIIDTSKYTKRCLEQAQRPIPGVDLGEDEETLDPEVCTPQDVDFIKPPPLDELVDPTKVKQMFIPKQGKLTKLLQQINTRIL